MLSAGLEEQDKVTITPTNEVRAGHRLPNLKDSRPSAETTVVEGPLGKAQSLGKKQEKVQDWLVLHIREILGEASFVMWRAVI